MEVELKDGRKGLLLGDNGKTVNLQIEGEGIVQVLKSEIVKEEKPKAKK
jgi:hypothetical protein